MYQSVGMGTLGSISPHNCSGVISADMEGKRVLVDMMRKLPKEIDKRNKKEERVLVAEEARSGRMRRDDMRKRIVTVRSMRCEDSLQVTTSGTVRHVRTGPDTLTSL